MSSIKGGVLSATFDGLPLNVADSVTVSESRKMKEMIGGLTGPIGTIPKPRTPFVEIEIVIDDETNLRDFEDRKGPAVVNFANGESTVVNDAELVGEPDHNGADGKATVRFEGITQDWY
jgi:hypothetical protein